MVRRGLVAWPQEYAERYVAAGYWAGESLGSWPAQWARRHADRTALVDGPTRLSYAELAERVDALAANLLRTGLSCGDNIVVQLPNCWEFVVVFLACQRIGVAPALGLAQHRDHELGHVAERVHAKAIVVPDRWRDYDHQALAARTVERLAWPVQVLVAGDGVSRGNLDLRQMFGPAAEARSDHDALDRIAPDPRDAAFFLLSGGTTGVPKLIARTHDDYGYSVRCSAQACGYDEGTVFLAALPAAHGLTLGGPGVLGALAVGGRVVMAPSPSQQTTFPLIAAERVTTTAVTPAVVQRWLDAAGGTPFDLSSLDMLQVAGAPLAREAAERVGPVLDCRLQQVFGMSEGLHCYTRAGDPAEVVLGTQGRPMSPGDELLVVDPALRPVPGGEVGELLVRGPTTIRGYYDDPDADTRAFAPGGWYCTGDLVCQDGHGNLMVKGRSKDVINRGGEKISAEEVERPLRGIPQVVQSSVIPVPDPELGERVCACVVLLPGHSLALADVREACLRAGLAAYKLPERLEHFESLPLTPVGKVDKKALRDRVLALTGAG